MDVIAELLTYADSIAFSERLLRVGFTEMPGKSLSHADGDIKALSWTYCRWTRKCWATPASNSIGKAASRCLTVGFACASSRDMNGLDFEAVHLGLELIESIRERF